MKLVFIQGGSRWKFDKEGNVYTETNFNDAVWKRYRSYCDHLIVLLRREECVYSKFEAELKFNKFDTSLADFVCMPDFYRPLKNIFSMSIRKKIIECIDNEIRSADKVIIRSLGNIYTNTALKVAKKYNKAYLVEVTGFIWEGMWYHSLRGKMVALYKEQAYKKMIADAPYAVYVTQHELQKRYPISGKQLGCSDVELFELDNSILKKRIEKIKSHEGNYIFGTSGFLDVKYKGQEFVIRAIAELKAEGITDIEYHLIGTGTGDYLKKISKKLGVYDQIKIVGTLSHEKVFEWYDTLDVYIHPGFIEGLCRSIVEAMSRALPVTCSSVGGNVELVNKDMMFHKGNVKEIKDEIKKLLIQDVQEKEALRSFRKAKEFDKQILDKKRDDFYMTFSKG